LLTNDDDRKQQCVVLELKTTAIVVFRSNTWMYNHTWNTMLVAEEATRLCILLGRYSVAWPETRYTTSWILISVKWMTAIEGKRTLLLSARLGFLYLSCVSWVGCLRRRSPPKRARREPRRLPRHNGRAFKTIRDGYQQRPCTFSAFQISQWMWRSSIHLTRSVFSDRANDLQ
jgi:hypothetical protein